MNKILLAILTACIFIFPSGCSIKPQIPFTYSQDVPAAVQLSDELKTRLLQYWAFRSSGNLEDAYKMEAPYIRELISFSTYNKLFSKGAIIDKIEIVRIEPVSNLFYNITLKLFYQMNDKNIRDSFLVDGWVKPDKVWYHMRKDPILRNYFP